MEIANGQLSLSEKRVILAEILKKKAGQQSTYQLSSPQLAVWFHQEIYKESTAFNIPLAICLHGKDDRPDAVKAALAATIERHAPLRTSFANDENGPIQQINRKPDISIPYQEIILPKGEDRSKYIASLSAKQAKRPFDLASDYLFRFELIKFDSELSVILATFHHIVFDGWSLGVFLKDFSQSYMSVINGGSPTLRRLNFTYRDYINNFAQEGSSEHTKNIRYWKSRLDNVPGVLELPSDYPRPQKQTFNGSFYSTLLDENLLKSLDHLSRETGVTFFITALASFFVLLTRFSGQSDLVVGVSTANRDEEKYRSLIGMFADVLPVRANLNAELSFAEFAKRLRDEFLTDYDHAQVSINDLIERLAPVRDLKYNALFQVGFGYQNSPWPSLGDHVSIISGDCGSSKLDLSLNLSKEKNHIIVAFEYNTDLFSSQTIHRFSRCYLRLLQDIVATKAQVKLSKLKLLSIVERDELIELGMGSQRDFGFTALPLLFEEHANECGDKTAAVFGSVKVTFTQLNQRVNRLTHHLLNIGIGAGSNLGICLDRSVDVLVSILAALKSGAAYVPMDLRNPRTRLQEIVKQCRFDFLITETSLAEQLEFDGVRQIVIDDQATQELLAGQSSSNPQISIASDDRAYVIYTSGSTGKPKGIEVTHGNLCHLAHSLRAQLSESGLSNSYRWAWNSPVVFDASLQAITQLSFGVEAHILSEEIRAEPMQLLQYMDQNDIGLFDCTPSYLDVLLQYSLESNTSLPNLIVGGEKIRDSLWRALREHGEKTGRFVLNVYGPTECTVDSTCALLANSESPTIGLPMINNHVYVLDPRQQLLPRGAIGELYIGGLGVSQGYLEMKQLTAESFYLDSYSDEGKRIYRTGDMVRWLPDGQLEYMGRKDKQVKIRGFRVELGDIESKLSAILEVESAVVVASKPNTHGDINLAAYVVVTDFSNTQKKTVQFKDQLAQLLPLHMIPETFNFLTELPLNINGKVDLSALPLPEGQIYEESCREPVNAVQRLLVSIWKELLELPRIGIDNNFFSSGGHSIAALRITFRLQKIFQLSVPVRIIFEHPTIAGLAEMLISISGDQVMLEAIADASLQIEQMSLEEVTRMLASED